MEAKTDVVSRMQKCLDQLGVPLKVLWTPKDDGSKHGEISSNYLLIYDRNECEAWLTFEHEVYEFKLKEVIFPYRTLINSLIETIEKLTYERKEKFLEFLPKISEIISKEKAKTKRFP